ncbi:TonB-dependent hemoglobin/transferrin/lactoferrin family receptor [Aliivibrio kagoshimensis]|uniref:TonB-dependent hemoglobin/transferrin/lactoferrin family receptor n=1 Tax=Aliivibrio kagoshimensis TaxID=2910230 RepID=UPI003D12F5BD
MSHHRTILSAAILVALSTNAHAEEVTTFDEVVVSATRTEQNISDVSSSIATVSSESIDNTMANNVKDALKYTPGVTANGSGRFGISGFNIRGMDDSRVKVMVDGVQQPAPYNPGANEQRKYPNAIEVDTLSTIEVNKGPSSTLYGSDALGGTVLMRTKNPEDVLKTDGDEHAFAVKTGYDSVDSSVKTTGTWAMRKDKLETLVMLTYKDGEEYQTHSDGADIDGKDRGAANPGDQQVGNLLAKAYYQINENHRVGATLEYYQNRYEEDELSQNGVSMGPGFTYTENHNKDKTERLRIGLEHEWTANMSGFDTLVWKLNVQQSESEYENFDTTPAMGKRMRVRNAQDNSIQFDAQFDKLVEFDSSYHQVTYGMSFQTNDFSTTNVDHKFDQGTVAPGHTDMPDATQDQWGIFAQDQIFLLDDDLILTAGIRYDSFKAKPETNAGFSTVYPDSESDAFTGKLGALYHFNQNVSAFAQISQGFKAPTVYDLYYVYERGSVIDANPDLKAESSISYETGLRLQSNAARIELVAFYNDYSDFIAVKNLGTIVGGPNNGKDHYTKENLDKAEIYGVELSSTLLLDEAINAPKGMYSKLSIAYTEGRDKKTGDHLDTVAPLTSNLGFGYDARNAKFGGLINVNMVASKDDWADDDIKDVAGYAVVDVTAYVRPMKDVTIRGGVFNVLDAQYWLYDDVSGYKEGNSGLDRKAQAGVNLGVDLTWEF